MEVDLMIDYKKPIKQIIRNRNNYIEQEYTIEYLQKSLLSPDYYYFNNFENDYIYYYSFEKTHVFLREEFYKPNQKKYIIKPIQNNIIDEYFVRVDNNIEIGNYGNIKLNNNYLEQYCTERRGYPWYVVYVNILGEEFKTYNLIADAFCMKPNSFQIFYPHHISNNAFDNRPENIIWVTPEEHSIIHASSLKDSINCNYICNEIVQRFPLDLSAINYKFYDNIRIHYTSLTFYFTVENQIDEIEFYKGKFIYLNDEVIEIYNIEKDQYGF
jgi:hypothetical protein